ncbi:MAG: hypothetical protein JW888_03390 [Pirellulales bacterium]|nr:hypothetical protein [Pirellulales bacterium]
MRALRIALLSVLATFGVLLPGCVELDGQRLSWYYDEANDQLLILLHYDGVHDSGSDEHGKGAEQLPEFVQQGDVMLLDWPLRVDMKSVREEAKNNNVEPLKRSAAQLITSIQVKSIGYYREPNGKLGAVQLITIPQAKAFVRQANALISQAILDSVAKASKDQLGKVTMPRTLERIVEAAKDDYPWITLDGHAVRAVCPVHPGEWDREKSKAFAEAAKDLARSFRQRPDKTEQEISRALAWFAAAPLSYIDRGDKIEVIVGRATMPSTFRAEIRDKYEPSLETALIDSVKTDLDPLLAEALLDEETKPSEAVAAVLKAGPPEEQVRALLGAFDRGDEQQKKAAVERLNRWAMDWNRTRTVPEAPTGLQPTDDLSAWKSWYTATKHRGALSQPEEKNAKPQADPPAKPPTDKR